MENFGISYDLGHGRIGEMMKQLRKGIIEFHWEYVIINASTKGL